MAVLEVAEDVAEVALAAVVVEPLVVAVVAVEDLVEEVALAAVAAAA